MTIINLTPHAITLNDGREFPPSGTVARVATSHSDFDDRGVCHISFSDVTDLPEPVADTLYIVSGMVASATPDRDDVVAPATGHPEAVRNDRGHIVSVPGWSK